MCFLGLILRSSLTFADAGKRINWRSGPRLTWVAANLLALGVKQSVQSRSSDHLLSNYCRREDFCYRVWDPLAQVSYSVLVFVWRIKMWGNIEPLKDESGITWIILAICRTLLTEASIVLVTTSSQSAIAMLSFEGRVLPDYPARHL